MAKKEVVNLQTKIRVRSSKGQFTKGNPGKPKGATSRKKVLVAEAIKEIVDKRANRILRIVDNLEDKEFLQVWLGLIEFVQPKLTRVESKNYNVNYDDVLKNLEDGENIEDYLPETEQPSMENKPSLQDKE